MFDFFKRVIRKIKRMLGIKAERVNQEKSRHLPDAVVRILEESGLNTQTFKFFVKSDMDSDGCYCTVWTAVDDKGLYVALGSEEIVKKRGNKKLETKYVINEIEVIR